MVIQIRESIPIIIDVESLKLNPSESVLLIAETENIIMNDTEQISLEANNGQNYSL